MLGNATLLRRPVVITDNEGTTEELSSLVSELTGWLVGWLSVSWVVPWLVGWFVIQSISLFVWLVVLGS